MRRTAQPATAASAATVGYEGQLWQMADALRGSMDAAEYKHVCLGLLFLKYIADAVEEKHAALLAEQAQGADTEDPDEYRAQAEGRDPGLPQPLADLFPARLVDSELGEIPEGWGVKSLDQIARFPNGLALQKHPPADGRSLPVIKIAQLRAGNAVGADRASADLQANYVVRNGDVLLTWSGSLECRFWAGGPGALNQHLFKVTSDKHPRWLCFLGIHQHLDDFRHIAAGKATTMGHIQRHHLPDAKLAVAPPALLRAVDPVIGPIVGSTWHRVVQSRTLAAVRNALLPQLISGELRVSDAEKLTEVTE
ncbi:MAG: type I restriction-modification system subunit M N-terminal domain-containing protein [Fimbriimonadaceae bacterium]|nr:type I restriction-modification system subunit M N-terminal domain-containing protein [Fimbriimonadaceae bacterium]